MHQREKIDFCFVEWAAANGIPVETAPICTIALHHDVVLTCVQMDIVGKITADYLIDFGWQASVYC